MPPVLQKTIREIHQRLRALETREYAEVVGPGSVINAQYLTLALHAVLTAERRFVAGDGLVGTDAGANADYTLDVDLVAAWSGLEFVGGELRIDEDADFTWTGTHTYNANILLAGGVTIDGMDPSAFLVTYAAHDHSAGDPTQVDHTDLVGVAADQHHAEVHIVNSTGPHAEGGLAVGNVLRASGAAAFSFAQLQHGDLGGVGADDHHAQVHVVNSTGPHAEAGLAVGNVLRASGAAAFAFTELQHGDLGGVGTDDHHNEDHILLSAPHTDTLADAVVDGDVIIGNITPRWSRLAIAIPGANVRNVLGIDNAELRPSWKMALDNVNPEDIGVTAPGTSLVFAHRDHVHAFVGGAPVHVVNSTGPHAEGGLTAGHVLRASAIAAFSFAALQAGDIPGLGGVPALTLGLVNAAGAAATYIQTDANIAIFDAVVPGTIQCDDAANTGAAAFAARRDHQHAIVCDTPVDIANANNEGIATYFARSDHIHNHPAALGANLHHTQIHDVVGGDHTLTGAQWNLVGATALNTIGLLLPLSDVSAPAEAILKSTAAGGLTLVDLTLTNDLLLADGAVIGIAANERIQFNAAGTIQVLGADLGIGVIPAYDLDVDNDIRARFMLIAKDTGVIGSVSLVSGEATHTGYIQWRLPSADGALGVRHGYMGWSTANVRLWLENSADFLVTGGDVRLGTEDGGGKLNFDEGTTIADGIVWGSDANKVTLYRSADDALTTDGTFTAGIILIAGAPLAAPVAGDIFGSGRIIMEGAGNNVFTGSVIANAGVTIADGQTLQWSDVTLYRDAANMLKTDDSLMVALGLNVGTAGAGTGEARALKFVTLGPDDTDTVLIQGIDTLLINEYDGFRISHYVEGRDWYSVAVRSINTGSTPSFLNPRLGFFVQDTNTYLLANMTEKMSILGSGNVIPGGNKTQDLGLADPAWDDIWCDVLNENADFYWLEQRLDATGAIVSVDDLAVIRDIQPSGEYDERTGLPLIDDGTLPDWIFTKDKMTGETARCSAGKPYIANKLSTSLSWGAIRQLDRHRIIAIAEREAIIERIGILENQLALLT